MKRNIFYAALFVFLLGIVLFFNLGNAVKSTIERVGTKTLGTSVHVRNLNVSLAKKSAAMSGLSIANPKGFNSDYLLRTDAVSVDVGEVTGKVITLKEIVVDGMVVIYELNPKGANLDVIKENLRSPAPVATKNKDGNGTEVIIQKIRIINAQVIPVMGIAHAPIRLPDITLNNIGSKSNPVSPAQVATQIMNKVLRDSSLAVIRAGLNVPLGETVTKVKNSLIKGLFSK